MPGVGIRRRLVSNQRFLGAAQHVRDKLVALSAPTPEHRAWREIDGDHTLRLEYDLTPESVVFDVGGFHGQWASDVVAMYGCRIHVFEPVPAYAESIERRFARNSLVTVHPYGLAASAGTARLAVSGEASSHVRATQLPGEIAEVPLRTPGDVMSELGLDMVDLVKLNIEGAEFDLVADLIATGLVERIIDLQVQFHPFVPDAARRLEELRRGLARTHQQTWSYDFLWESWRRRDAAPEL
jgi:FkbM family methyltransferase